MSLVRFALAAGLVVVAGPGQAQMRIPEKFTNLQVLPKDITREELTGIMRSVAGATGYRCGDCHAGEMPEMDFASDEKDMKKTAREMFRMVADINGKIAGMGRTLDARSRVRCVTCHHGIAKPRTLSAELLSAYDAKGIDSTKALFKALRTRYFGRSAYDFSDQSLGGVAEEIASKPERRADAIALLQTQLEFTPQSGAVYMSMARIHVAARDTAQAVAALTKGAEADPQNRQLQQMLNALKGGGRPPR
jgi:predicted Zn-dependent protease